jgi:hypothetical protein
VNFSLSLSLSPSLFSSRFFLLSLARETEIEIDRVSNLKCISKGERGSKEGVGIETERKRESV